MSELTHAGVKGMKWGVRKSDKPSYSDRALKETVGPIKTSVTTKSGDRISIEKEPLGPIATAVAKITGRKPHDNVTSMVVRDPSGKKAGSFQIFKDGPGVIRGEWLQINSSHQGRGYSEAALGGLIKAAKKDPSLKEVRLQVPGDAAPAKHIYSKLGFSKDYDLGSSPIYGTLEEWVYKVR